VTLTTPGNTLVQLGFEIPALFYEASRDSASSLGMNFSEYGRCSLSLVRQIGKNGIGPAAQIIVDPELYPLPRLRLPPNEQDQQRTSIKLLKLERVALRQDCLRTGNSARNRVLRCLNFTNYLVELGAMPPTIRQQEINYTFLRL
jgi:hypothetical protein